MVELIDAFDRAESDGDVGVIVLTGSGGNFCTGGDVGMENGFTADEGRRITRILMRLAEAVRGAGKPVIAMVRGWCVGGGNELCLMCDLALAAESARFAHTDSRLGSSPIWYGTQLLTQILGERRAKEIVLLGKTYTAEAAAEIGLINAQVPDAELESSVREWCETLLSNSPQAMRLSKVSINFEGDAALPSVRHGWETLHHFYDTDEFHEGTSAFLERRKPNFRPGSSAES
jgi:naphthoate synthase/2-ketocyclohexanecarboxyl-CoA hydrolase